MNRSARTGYRFENQGGASTQRPHRGIILKRHTPPINGAAGSALPEARDPPNPPVGVSYLPYCYDDVVQAPWETCDAATEMNCTPGDTCVDCAACITGGGSGGKLQVQAHSGYFDHRQEEAQVLRPTGVARPRRRPGLLERSGFDVRPRDHHPSKVPAVLPADIPVTRPDHSFVTALGSNSATTIAPLGVVGPQTKCAANKFKAESFRMVGKIKCHSKALAQLQVVDPVCLTRVNTKYATKYAAAEALGCAPGNIGNSPAIEGLVATFVNPDIVGSILP